ncbi:2-hydroxyacid dehydrogenase [Beijerinckia indica]|uniref:D-isomer specific 2-hydroxyacid dehydrogenase NAD-binding n=1 Tax=Beijerinckia indica subsp. indica (strain ATCC 9039 / DSM 1715 / NCIMB 8712) TaxID=395963 RepID=B2IIP1_BEII9|nr:2-hydroxyacid dehydrogenase [Beijerinckia indica]ACB94734.1 D-isomer specific 2-hydroxyacid dehydrogenase NAD-binding [Beijerinckia indica subsp. indica ATCC 9039]
MPDFDILLPSPLPAKVVQGLAHVCKVHPLWEAADPQALIGQIKDKVQGLATCYGKGKIDGDFMSQFPNLKIVSHYGVGYDIIDAAWAGAHHIVVTNTPDVLNDEVADLAIGLMLATIRQIPQADTFLRAGHWLKGSFPLTATLRERRLGIFGLGRIGKAIAKRAAAFDIEIAYCGRKKQDDVPYRFYPSLLELARESDILMVIAPATHETTNAVNAEVLSALGANGVLINVARGSLVDENALIEALKNKTILSAGLDVFAAEPQVPQALIDMEQVVLLPHVGSASHYTRDAMGQLVVDNLISFAEGRGPLTPVAETPWPFSA